MGLQKVASFCAIGCYYLVGVPVGSILAFCADLGVAGLQGGYFAAVFVLAMAFTYILRTKNWQDIANEAIKRIKDENSKS